MAKSKKTTFSVSGVTEENKVEEKKETFTEEVVEEFKVESVTVEEPVVVEETVSEPVEEVKVEPVVEEPKEVKVEEPVVAKAETKEQPAPVNKDDILSKQERAFIFNLIADGYTIRDILSRARYKLRLSDERFGVISKNVRTIKDLLNNIGVL